MACCSRQHWHAQHACNSGVIRKPRDSYARHSIVSWRAARGSTGTLNMRAMAAALASRMTATLATQPFDGVLLQAALSRSTCVQRRAHCSTLRAFARELDVCDCGCNSEPRDSFAGHSNIPQCAASGNANTLADACDCGCSRQMATWLNQCAGLEHGATGSHGLLNE